MLPSAAARSRISSASSSGSKSCSVGERDRGGGLVTARFSAPPCARTLTTCPVVMGVYHTRECRPWRSAPADEWHLRRHHRHELHIGFERQARHVHDRVGN